MAKRIYVTNIPRTVTKSDITQTFSAYGTVESVSLSAGSAVVMMSSGGDRAIKSLHQTDMGGRRISVTPGKQTDPDLNGRSSSSVKTT